MQIEPWKNCRNSVAAYFELRLLDLLPQHLADSMRSVTCPKILKTRLVSFLSISTANLKEAKAISKWCKESSGNSNKNLGNIYREILRRDSERVL